MTDSPLDARSSAATQSGAVTLGDAATLNNSVPAWNLLAPEAGFPFHVELNGSTFEVYGILKQPYSADDLIAAIDRNRGGYRRTAQTLENVKGDDHAFAELTDKLFLRLEGTTSDDPAVHRHFLEANFRLKAKIARDGLGGIVIDQATPIEAPTAESDKLDLLPLALDTVSDNVIHVKQELWSPALKKKVLIRMMHTLRLETERDWRVWTRTASERFTKANNQWTEGVNWNQRLELYDAMIKRVEGMVLGDALCEEANRTEWIPRIPAWHKLLVIGEVFDESRVKN